MARLLLAAAVATAALAAPASADDCVGEYRYAISNNPYDPLPSGGGGGEPGGGPMPGQPRDYAEYDVAKTVAFAKCLAP